MTRRVLAKRTTRVVAYVRVSKEREEMISPAVQEDAIRAACARKGYVLVEVIEDLDKTGRNFARAGVQRAIAMVQAGHADVVMVWRFSRFGRNSLDYRVNMHLVEEAGGQLEAALEDADPTTSTGRLTRGLLIELAEFESERISEGWREALAARGNKGLPANGRERFGYRYHRCGPGCPVGCRTGYSPDPVTGPVLASLYRRYLGGESMPALRDWCVATGQPRERGGRWVTSSVAELLDTGFGAGLLHSGGYLRAGTRVPHEWVPGAHPALISAAEWQAYLARRDLLRHVPSSHKAPVYALTGLVFCGLCQGSMFAASSARGRGYLYRCGAMQNTGECPGVWRVRSAVEAAVLDALDVYADRLEAAAREALRSPRPRPAVPGVPSPGAQARRDLKAASDGVARLVEMVALGHLTEEQVAAESRRLGAAGAAAQAVLDRLDAAPAAAPGPVEVRALREQWPELPVAARRAIVLELFDRVVVHGDKTVEVVRRFGTG